MWKRFLIQHFLQKSQSEHSTTVYEYYIEHINIFRLIYCTLQNKLYRQCTENYHQNISMT